MTASPRYHVLPWLVVRAPLLAATDFGGFGEEVGANLDDWGADPEVAFAVAVASPDLTETFAAAPSASAAPPAAQAALQRYLIRAATRPTPFGGFAAVALARWDQHTDLEVAPGRRPTRTRPDMEWLTEVAGRLSRDPDCLPGLRVYANTCSFERDGRIYLADPGTGGVHTGPDVSVRATPMVRRVLALARAGIAEVDLRRQILDAAPTASVERADRLLDQLSKQQFLLPELLPGLLGDPVAHVLKSLDGIAATPTALEWSDRLTAVVDACREVDLAGPAAATSALGEVRALLAAIPLPAPPELVIEPTTRRRQGADVQLDTGLHLSGTGVTRAIADDVSRMVDLLFQLHPNPAWAPLAGYRAAFHRRYGEDRRVRLLELLDPRFGLGLPWAHDGDPDGDGHDREAAARRATTLRTLVATAIRDGGSEVVLDDRLVERLSSGPPPDARRLPPSVELSVFVAAHSRTAVDRGNYLLVVGPNLGAQAAGRGLGRFADLIGPDASDALAEAAVAEAELYAAESGAVVAELVYRPLRARSANVAVRPLVREYELPVGVAPTVPSHRVVHVDELSVGIQGGRFQVWWDAVDRPLDLTSGHMLNSAAAPAVCRALLDLTSDGRVDLPVFDWGSMAEMPFLPRVRYGRAVLSPAQWRLEASDLGDASGEFDDRLDAWRARWRVPALVYLTSADNRLLLNLDDASHRAQARAAMNGAGHPLVLHEALPGPADGWLPGPRGGLMVELVVPLVRTQTADRPRPTAGGRAITPAWGDSDRRRPPGSDWVYVTLEGPGRTEDELLAGSLGDLAEGFVERGDADGWFFVRYADPDRQLRLRVHGRPQVLAERVLPELTRWAAAAIAAGLRTRMVLQTYERELERYGGPEATTTWEMVACVDSSAIRGLLGATRPFLRSGDLDRIELALVSVADLLASLTDQDQVERARWAKGLAGKAAAGGQLFRDRKLRLRALVHACDDGSWNGMDGPWDRVGQLVGEVLARRRADLAPLVAQLRAHWIDGTGLRSPEELCASIVHLHANRLGLDRSAEHLILGVVDRTLRSLLAHPPRSPAERGPADPSRTRGDSR